jgi:hypothetical protein
MTRRRRRINLLSVFYFVVTLGILVGGSLWIDHGSSPVAAKVTSKSEQIHVSFAPQGAWYRSYHDAVEFTTGDGRPGTATIGV